MIQSNILLTDVEIPVFDNLVSTNVTLNTNSPSNNDILPTYETVDNIPPISPGSGSIFPTDPELLPKITNLSDLLKYLSEIMIRFNSNPKYYLQNDFALLVKTISNSLIYLYTQDSIVTDSAIEIPFIGLATLETDPGQDAINLNSVYKGIYLANEVGDYTHFDITVTSEDKLNSVILLVPSYSSNSEFLGYNTQVCPIDVSNKEDVGVAQSLVDSVDQSKWELSPNITYITANQGRLYDETAFTNLLLPTEGWHVPTKAEWDILFSYINTEGVTYAPAYKLMINNSTDFKNLAPYTGPFPNDQYGFSARGAGRIEYNEGQHYFENINQYGFYAAIDGHFSNQLRGPVFESYSRIQSDQHISSYPVAISVRLIKDNSINEGDFFDYDGNIYNSITIGTQVWAKQNLIVKHYRDGTPLNNSLANPGAVLDFSSTGLLNPNPYEYAIKNITIIDTTHIQPKDSKRIHASIIDELGSSVGINNKVDKITGKELKPILTNNGILTVAWEVEFPSPTVLNDTALIPGTYTLKCVDNYPFTLELFVSEPIIDLDGNTKILQVVTQEARLFSRYIFELNGGGYTYNDFTNTDLTLFDVLSDAGIANAISKAHSQNTDNQLVNGTHTVSLDAAGNLNVENIVQNGTSYETHAEQVYTEKDTIILREKAVSGLGIGEYTGFVAKLYDGVNDGQFVFDKDGWARVGDVGALQKLATIEETTTNDYLMKYNTSTNRLEGISNLLLPISTSMQNALNLKANLAGDNTFAGLQTINIGDLDIPIPLGVNNSLTLNTSYTSGDTLTTNTGLLLYQDYSGIGTITSNIAQTNYSRNLSSGIITNLNGIMSYARNEGSGRAINMAGGYFSVRNNTTGSYDRMVGLQSYALNNSINVACHNIYGFSTRAVNTGVTDAMTAVYIEAYNTGGTNGQLNLMQLNAYDLTGVVDFTAIDIGRWHNFTGTPTNSYGIYLDASTNRGSGINYAIYSGSTAPSTFAGILGATQLQSTIAIGTAPLTVVSTTVVSNLNADLLDGQHGSYYQTQIDLKAPIASPTFTGIVTTSASGIKASKIYPSADGVTAIQLLKANGTTSILNVDTTNSRIGIGNVAPNVELDVTGNINATSNVNAGYGGNFIRMTPGTTGIITTYLSFGLNVNNGTRAITIDTAGNVGIGATSPTNILSFGNGADRKIWIEAVGSDVTGKNLTIAASNTAAGTTLDDKNGGGLILQAGLGAGAGTSTISFQTGTTLGTGKTLQTMSTKMTILGSGNIGFGVTNPTAALNLKAGTATAGTSPLKFTSGTLMTVPEVGSLEFLTDTLYFTQTTGATRQQLSYYQLSTETTIGQLAIANLSEATAGLDDTKAMSPLKTYAAYRLNYVPYSGALDNLDMGSYTVFADTLVLPKTSGKGIKVDPASPTFGWKDLIGYMNVDAAALNAATLSTFIGGSIRRWAFSAGDKADLEFHIPHDYVPGTDMYIHYHWSHNGTAISGNIVGTFVHTYSDGYGGVFSAEKTVTSTYATTNIATTPRYVHRIEETQLSSAGGSASLLDSSLIKVDGVIGVNFTMTTIPTITGGTPNEPFVFFVDIHYQSTQMGTKTRNTPFYS